MLKSGLRFAYSPENAVGTSAGGRQPKGIIAVDRKTGEIRSGQINVDTNLDYYILKFGDKYLQNRFFSSLHVYTF